MRKSPPRHSRRTASLPARAIIGWLAPEYEAMKDRRERRAAIANDAQWARPEFLVPSHLLTPEHMPLMAAINQGWRPDAGDLVAAGGQVDAKASA